MEANLDLLSQQLAALTQRFADLGAKLAEAARELQVAGAPPSDALVEELATARGQFIELRTEVLGVAEAASVTVPQGLEGLAGLEPVLTAVADAIAAEVRRAALEQARHAITTVLDRVLEIVHRDDPSFASLVGCHVKAEELRVAVAELTDPDPARVQAVTDSIRAFSDLLTMIEGHDALDDEQYARLEESVSRTFGRALAVAVARGRLVIGSIPEDEAPAPAAIETPAPLEEVPLEVEREVEQEPAPEPEPLEPEHEMPIAVEQPLELEPSAVERDERYAPIAAADEPPFVVAPPEETPLPMAELEPIMAAPEPVAMAAPEPAQEPSAPDETAQWWLAAWARWSGWKSTLGFPEAVREELAKYPYLLSVPIQKSPEYEDGLAAYGYSIVMEHVEKKNPGCVANALNSLKQTSHRTVGDQLYDYLVNEGKLGQTYPDFVRGVMLAALPTPGLWFQSRMLDSKEDTRLFQRPTPRLGETEQTGKRLASDAQRFAEHKFSATLPPLTARFFVLMADHKDNRGLGVKVSVDGVPSDSAWLVTIPQAGKLAKVDARRVSEDGSAVPGFGRDYAAMWVGVFNKEAAGEHTYEIAVTLRKDSRSPYAKKT
ncbi:MAG TPA: hypothetical protein VGU22_15280 [Methylomirabilota bacterium]|jgi:hypothetical protein|nr:hypothetical protein [Methylomirabilota bacterium]